MGNLRIEQTPDISQKNNHKAIQSDTQKDGVKIFNEENMNGISKGIDFISDWLQDKDKVCTDGKDDGKIGFLEGTKSFALGLIGGIPKAIINHPIATVATVGVGVLATAFTGGAIIPVFGAIGAASGIGMTGYGVYKAANAKTDGEAKQAFETMGMGVATTALSVKSAGQALEKASEAGVKSAQVSENATSFRKTIQMFKSIPECLSKSKQALGENINWGLPVSENLYKDNTDFLNLQKKGIEITEIYEADSKLNFKYGGKIYQAYTNKPAENYTEILKYVSKGDATIYEMRSNTYNYAQPNLFPDYDMIQSNNVFSKILK